MTSTHSADDMYGRVFPGEKWTITFEATDEQADAMTVHVDAHTADPGERLMFLQMLGLAEYESGFNPDARDAWTKKRPEKKPSLNCRNGHPRSEYGFKRANGATRCRECRRLENARRAARKRAARAEAKKAAA